MATSTDQDQPSLVTSSDQIASNEREHAKDPFISKSGGSNHHRYSHFDTQLFSLGPAASPEQAKHALEAHLAETQRRIEDASRLGTTLVQQRHELEKRLEEVDKQQSGGEMTQELRQKLEEIEREYNEVGRETARAFLPKSRVSSSEMGAASPFVGDTKRSASPSKFESQATSSPSKLSVPNRKQRNQPSSRVRDIEFAAEISTSLLSEVRLLQALLLEKEETLKTVTLENSRLEVEAEGFQQRLRNLDESEHRYKDENWNLETQIHEHIAVAKESADREKKMTLILNALQAEKAAAQKELDETKLMHARLAEDHATAVKHHDVELGSAKRNITMVENERGSLQRKIEDLASQNQELAMAVAQHRGRMDDRDQARGLSDEDFESAASNVTPEHSPPPSPVKGTPRHSMLESETLKSSLHHAHRMIQSLKGNIHREKTEKSELKRMLQDARDELESRRGDASFSSSGNAKRNKKADSKEFKKPLKPGQLGGLRSSRSEISMEDPSWEDHEGQDNISHSTAVVAVPDAAGKAALSLTREAGYDSGEHFDTSNETSDAFETANERGTETEDFHTGAEDFSGSDLTETEGGPAPTGSVRSKIPSALPLGKAGNRNSFQSTASLSGDEYRYEDVKTPVQTQPQRLRLRMNRGGVRRSRGESEEPNLNSSPASFATSSKNGTPQAPGQTLFAELEDLNGGSEDESVDATPSRRSIMSSIENSASRPGTAQEAIEAQQLPPLVLVPMTMMVDTGMMTDAWEPISPATQSVGPIVTGAGLAGDLAGVVATAAARDRETSREDTTIPKERLRSNVATQWHEEQLSNLLKVQSNAGDHSRPISTSTYSNMSSHYGPDMDEKLAEFPAPPTSSEHNTLAEDHIRSVSPIPLTLSTIQYEHVEPVPDRDSKIFGAGADESEVAAPGEVAIPAVLAFSSIQAVTTEPISPAPLGPDQIVGMVSTDGKSKDFTKKSQDTARVDPATPKAGILGSVFGWNKNKASTSPIIAEDETRQSPSGSPQPETPESQKPFKEISANTNERGIRKQIIHMTDESSQTALTAQQIENMLKEKNRRKDVILAEDFKGPLPMPPSRGMNVSPPLKSRKSQESIGSVGRARAKMTDPDFAHDTVQLKRPNSAGSNRGSISSPHPPLPNDHKQVIAAAAQRVSSATGSQGTMGPPLLPASAYRTNPAFRPRTPSINTQNPLVSSAGRGGTTPRAGRTSESGDLQSPSINASRSRRSSFSSFVSEVDNRFNLRQNMPHGMDPGADPRMIQAITQTMIGEYLWKYTRKTGRGEMSENRHRRYFWVHPYTRTLYWSDRDPSQAGRAELKAKSVAIEAVRVVTDDNPMPPGLHRKSLIILTPGRAVKFTAATGQRHETWFNALSYLLLRTANDGPGGDTEEVASGALTREDVDEFNPGYTSRPIRQGPPSLSSYNSRTTRNESPAPQSTRSSMQRPIAGHESKSSRASTGTFSRLSSYWKPDKEGVVGSLGSRRARQSIGGNGSIYEASEVHDSAEDLREIIENQDRESDRLENVRACCDGKHDVGSLSHSSKKGRHSNSHSRTSRLSSTPRPGRQSQHIGGEAA